MNRLLLIFIICLALILFVCLLQRIGWGEEIGICSWYSTKESKGVMANGHKLDDSKNTCASWTYPFDTLLRVTKVLGAKKMGKGNDRHNDDSKSVVVLVTDRGPGQPKCSCLKKPQRIIDLSKRAFSEIADLKQGLIQVKIERH